MPTLYGTMNKMQLWLRNYENLRHSKNPKERNEFWTSSKYPIENMPWQELQQLYLPEVKMRFGPAVSALKKLWKSYKIAGRNGEPRGDIAWKINRIQSAMGLEKSQFPELEGMNDDEDQELTDEEIQAKREEKEDSGGEWESNLNFGTSQEKSEFTDEWSEEDKQLLKEERESEDDWWFN